MGKIIKFKNKEERELSSEEKILDNGITLEYLCNKLYSVHAFEFLIRGNPTIFVTADISGIEPHYSNEKRVFGVFYKGHSLSTDRYFLLAIDDFDNTDFIDDKSMLSSYLIRFIESMFSTKDIEQNDV